MRYIMLTLLLAGCAHAPAHVPVAPQSPTYAQGFADGKRAELSDLRNSPAFHVSRPTLAPCRDQVSWLPRGPGRISDNAWWASRKRNIWLLKQCRNKDAAKRAAIIQMLESIRNP